MGLSKISYNVDTNSRFSKRASQGEAGLRGTPERRSPLESEANLRCALVRLLRPKDWGVSLCGSHIRRRHHHFWRSALSPAAASLWCPPLRRHSSQKLSLSGMLLSSVFSFFNFFSVPTITTRPPRLLFSSLCFFCSFVFHFFFSFVFLSFFFFFKSTQKL